MIKEDIIFEVLKVATSTGGDYGELFVENSASNTLNMAEGRIASVLSGVTKGASIRVFCGLQSYYGFTTDLSYKGLVDLAKKIANNLKEKNSLFVPDLKTMKTNPTSKSIIMPRMISNVAKVEALKEAYSGAKAVSQLCKGINGLYYDMEQNVQIATTEGYVYNDTRPYTRLQVSLAAVNGSEIQMGFEDFMEAEGFDCIIRRDPRSIGEKAAKTAVGALGSIECPSGELPVIFSPSGGGTFLHEACGHPLEASYAARENTLFYNSIGKKMMCSKISITDNGIYPNGWGATAVDDEGVLCQKTVLVENGIVKNYMIDRLNSRRLNRMPTGNGRKQSYRQVPTSRMHQLYIEPGKDTLNDMLSGISKGLYVEDLGGGCANGNTGTFTVSTARAFLIEDGEIKNQVRTATLIGKTLEAMNDLDMVGDDEVTSFGGGYCGSESGNLPVGNGTPHIRIKKLTVSGRG